MTPAGQKTGDGSAFRFLKSNLSSWKLESGAESVKRCAFTPLGVLYEGFKASFRPTKMTHKTKIDQIRGQGEPSSTAETKRRCTERNAGYWRRKRRQTVNKRKMMFVWEEVNGEKKKRRRENDSVTLDESSNTPLSLLRLVSLTHRESGCHGEQTQAQTGWKQAFDLIPHPSEVACYWIEEEKKGGWGALDRRRPPWLIRGQRSERSKVNDGVWMRLKVIPSNDNKRRIGEVEGWKCMAPPLFERGAASSWWCCCFYPGLLRTLWIGSGSPWVSFRGSSLLCCCFLSGCTQNYLLSIFFFYTT